MNSCKPSISDFVQQAQIDAEALRQTNGVENISGPAPEIPGYQIESTINRGGQSVVYLARRQSDSVDVAIKVLRTGQGASAEEKARFDREIELLQSLEHPGIVKIFDSGTIDGRIYLVVQLIAGEMLMQHIDQQQPTIRQRIELFHKVVDAVCVAHQRGIIHRDLKPSNVLVDDQGGAHLIDFGLAGLIDTSTSDTDSLTQSGLFIGSVPWASPEHAGGNSKQIDVRSDVYSLGVMLFQVLTGVFPYSVDGSPLEVLRRICEQPPEPLRSIETEIDRDLETITLTCLSKDPAQRYQSADLLKQDLQHWLDGDVITARRDSSLKMFRQTARRYRYVAGLAAICSLAGFLFGITMRSERQVAQKQAMQFEAEVAEKARENEELLKKIASMVNAASDDQHWIVAFDNARRMRELPRGKAYEAMQRTWDKLNSTHEKQQFLKSIFVADSPDAHLGLHLGMLDQSPGVNSWASEYLTGIALFDVAAERDRYLAWHNRHKDSSAGETLLEGFRRIQNEVATAIESDDYQAATDLMSDANNFGRFSLLENDPDLIEQVHSLSLPALAIDVIERNDAPTDLKKKFAYILWRLPLKESLVKERIVPLLPKVEPSLLGSLTHAIQKQNGDWVQAVLMNEMRRQLEVGISPYDTDIADALAEQDDPVAIPLMIAAIDADNTYDTIYGVGYFGLTHLTGVNYDKSHDGAWWRNWWNENKDRYQFSDAEKEIPSLTLVQRQPPAVANNDLSLAGDNPNMQYLLHASPDVRADYEGKANLLLVMPGGAGGADFAPFVKNIAKNALPGHWLVAQLIAPVWDAQQANKIVWPTEKRPYDGMQFSTEAFAKAVIQDVRKRWDAGVDRVILLAWSSGGPAGYACLLHESMSSATSIDGALIAMSVYKPDQLPNHDAAKGKRIYVLHSPEDFIKMQFPELAIEQLSAAGAEAKLATYSGGHGWHGDVFGNIRQGIEWLSRQEE